MLNFSHAQQILPQVWHLPDFFLDLKAVQQSYRTNAQPWTSQYPNRLLTSWITEGPIHQALQSAPAEILKLTGHRVRPQVGYASMDLSSSQIMMHRLHPDIKAYIQVFTGEAASDSMCTVFCNNGSKNAQHASDYADISEFDMADQTKFQYQPNHAWLMINDPRCFFGTSLPVAANQVRETVCLHFAAELPGST